MLFTGGRQRDAATRRIAPGRAAVLRLRLPASALRGAARPAGTPVTLSIRLAAHGLRDPRRTRVRIPMRLGAG